MNRNLALRSVIALILLAASWLTLYAFETHVRWAGPLPEVALTKPLSDLPLQLGEWEGVDRPVTDERALYADEHLQRLYSNRKTQQTVLVWLAYSKQGEDRGHHPEICMAVAGRPEDTSERLAFEAPGHPAPLQRYRFGTLGNQQWVFYWHYTLVPSRTGESSEIQRFYQRLNRRPSSVTLEIFAPENSPTDADGARDFALLLDAALQPHLGSTAVRGSKRLPVTIIRGEEPPANLPNGGADK